MCNLSTKCFTQSKCPKNEGCVIRDSDLSIYLPWPWAPCPHEFTCLSGPAAHQPLWLSNFREILPFSPFNATKGFKSARHRHCSCWLCLLWSNRRPNVWALDWIVYERVQTNKKMRYANSAGDETCCDCWGWCLEKMKSIQLKYHPSLISKNG